LLPLDAASVSDTPTPREISLSVVVPTYNRASSLAVTLAGLLRQDYPTHLYEVVVVSDGSTDETAKVVDEYSKSAQNFVKFIEQVNSGPSVARNRGVSEAVNDVIVFIDDDVEPVEGFLEFHASWHRQTDIFAVIGPMSPDVSIRDREPPWITWEHDKLQRIYQMFKPDGTYPNGEGGPMHFYSGNASVHRKWLQQSGGFDVRYKRQEDVELAVRLSKFYGIRFPFDFRADGIHRPVRRFESWLRIPSDYGRLDAQRLADGSISYDSIRGNFENRHIFSRKLTSLSERAPLAATVVIAILKCAALLASRLKARKIAILLLSGLYSALYSLAFFNERRRQGATNITPINGSEPNSTGKAHR